MIRSSDDREARELWCNLMAAKAEQNLNSNSKNMKRLVDCVVRIREFNDRTIGNPLPEW